MFCSLVDILTLKKLKFLGFYSHIFIFISSTTSRTSLKTVFHHYWFLWHHLSSQGKEKGASTVGLVLTK